MVIIIVQVLEILIILCHDSTGGGPRTAKFRAEAGPGAGLKVSQHHEEPRLRRGLNPEEPGGQPWAMGGEGTGSIQGPCVSEHAESGITSTRTLDHKQR